MNQKKINKQLKKELRYIVKIPDNIFNQLPPKKKHQRTDWYFQGYRIRHFESDLYNWDKWLKIVGDNGLTEKRKIQLTKPSKKEIEKFDSTSKFKITALSKYPVINDKELYIEKVSIYKKGKLIDSFYSSEVETENDLKNIELLNKISGVTFKSIGNATMEEMVTKKLYKI